jgi:hypothetical protein
LDNTDDDLAIVLPSGMENSISKETIEILFRNVLLQFIFIKLIKHSYISTITFR